MHANHSDSARIAVSTANALILGFSALATLLGHKAFSEIPFLLLASALLFAALIAETRNELGRFWLFNLACLLVVLG